MSANQSGKIFKDGKEYTYSLPMTIYDHECEEWETAVEGLFPQPKPNLAFEADYIGLKYKVTCSHCLSILSEVDLVEM